MPQAPLNIAVRAPYDRISILDIQGQITGEAEETLMAAWHAASSGGADTLILNLSEAESMNSFGFGLLVAFRVHVQRSRQRLLAYGLSDHVKEIFEVTHLNEVMGLYPDEAAALRAVGH